MYVYNFNTRVVIVRIKSISFLNTRNKNVVDLNSVNDSKVYLFEMAFFETMTNYMMCDHYIATRNTRPDSDFADPYDNGSNTDRKTSINDLNDDCLIAICRYVNVLDLHSLSEVSPRFKEIIKSFHSNCTLHTYVNPTSFDYMTKMFKNVGYHIQTLFINFKGMGDDKPLRMMTTIQESCSGTLKNLCIKNWEKMKLHEIKPLLAGLRTIHLDGCDGIETTDNSIDTRIMEVLSEQKQIEVLSMIDCEKFMKDEDMAKVMENKPNLCRLQILLMSSRGFTGLPLALSKLPNLQYLTLHMDSTRELELVDLVEIKSLRSLQLTYYYKTTEDVFHSTSEMLRRTLIALKNQDHLEELVLHDCRLDDEGYEAIGRIKSLRHLAIRKHYWATDRICLLISANTKLRTIDLFDCIGITDRGILTLIEMCPELEMLDISWCSQLSSKLIRKVYNAIRKRPRTSYTFELFLGGSTRLDFERDMLLTSGQGLMRLVYDPCLSVDYRPSRNMKSILDAIEYENMSTKKVRLPTNPQFVCRKEFINEVTHTPPTPYLYMCDKYEHSKSNRVYLF